MSATISRKHAILCLIGAILGYGMVPLFTKYFSSHLDAWTANGFRYTLASLLWVPFLIRSKEKNIAGISIWKAAMIPAIVNILGQVIWAYLPYPPFNNDASVIGFVVRIMFLFTIVLGVIFVKEERIIVKSKGFWLGALLSMCGLMLFYMGKVDTSTANWLGVSMIALSAFFYAAYGVSVSYFMKSFPSRLSFGVVSMYTSICLLIFTFSLGNPMQLFELSLMNFVLLTLSGIIGIGVSHIFLYEAIKGLGPIISQGALMAAPFVTAAGAMLFLNESMTASEWAGGFILITSGFILLQKKKALSAPKSHTDVT